jgi:hypothetical protein
VLFTQSLPLGEKERKREREKEREKATTAFAITSTVTFIHAPTDRRMSSSGTVISLSNNASDKQVNKSSAVIVVWPVTRNASKHVTILSCDNRIVASIVAVRAIKTSTNLKKTQKQLAYLNAGVGRDE